MNTPTAPSGRTVHIKFNQKQRQQMVSLFDTAVKAAAGHGSGLPAVRAAQPIALKLLPQTEGDVEVTLTEIECSHIANLFNAAIQVGGISLADTVLPIIDAISAELQSAIVPATAASPLATARR